MKMLSFLLFISFSYHITQAVAEPELYETEISLATTEKCSVVYLEREIGDTGYNNLKDDVLQAIRGAYGASNKGFYRVVLDSFQCKPASDKVFANVVVSMKSKQSVNQVLAPIDAFLNTKQTVFTGESKSGFTTVLAPKIVVVITVDDVDFCGLRDDFRNLMAPRLYSLDGVTTALPSSIVFTKHSCTGEQNTGGEFEFYVMEAGSTFIASRRLTQLAGDLIKQMIFDGSTWKLGVGLAGKVTDLDFKGDFDEASFSATEITYIGFGTVAALLLLITVIVYLVSCMCGKDEEEKEKVKEKESNDVRVGYTNKSYANAHNDDSQVDSVTFYDKTDEALPPNYSSVTLVGHQQGDVPTQVVVEKLKHSDYHHSPPGDKVYVGSPEPAVVVIDDYQTFHQPPKSSHQPPPDNRDEPSSQQEVTPLQHIPIYATPDSHHNESPAQSDYEQSSHPDNLESSDEENTDLVFTKDQLNDLLHDPRTVNDIYNGLDNPMPTTDDQPELTQANTRSPGIIPWSENRVMLPIVDYVKDSFYINAHYIKGANKQVEYIATQAPTASSVNNFWRMVWLEGVKVIATFTPQSLDGKDLCFDYWPRTTIPRTVWGITVQLTKKELKECAQLTFKITRGEETRELVMYRFVDWCGDTPADTPNYLCTLLKIRHTKPLVHCSSGIGMGAVSIAALQAFDDYDTRRRFNVGNVVKQLRRQLAGAVERADQFQLLLKVLQAYAEDH